MSLIISNSLYFHICRGADVDECVTLFFSNKECPTCRKKLVSKRSLRPDPNFDALISKCVFYTSDHFRMFNHSRKDLHLDIVIAH